MSVSCSEIMARFCSRPVGRMNKMLLLETELAYISDIKVKRRKADAFTNYIEEDPRLQHELLSLIV